MFDPTNMSLDEYIEMNQIKPRLRGQRNGPIRATRPVGRESRMRGRDGFGGQWRSQDLEDDDDEEEEERWGRRRNPQRRRLDDESTIRRRRPTIEEDVLSECLDDTKEDSPQEGKVFVSNLHPEVVIADLKELFSALGPVKTANVHYDRLGRALGTADILYEKRTDAMRAIRQYNGVPLDGKEMRLGLLRPCAELCPEGATKVANVQRLRRLMRDRL